MTDVCHAHDALETDTADGADGVDDADGADLAGESGGDHVLVTNAGDANASVDVLVGRDGAVWATEVTLAPGETEAVTLPTGDGRATVEVHGGGAVASTTFSPGASDLPPLFSVRGGRVLVASRL